ncbi:hypothetical protein BRD17_08365 [Halobacteriales archaeon SW_7_68_16]|nr:MAG: hypothetical protein BRD17_08365 [Halobacteriales archaeon SW_7_68_16]
MIEMGEAQRAGSIAALLGIAIVAATVVIGAAAASTVATTDTLSDDFDDGTIDTTLWSIEEIGGASASETGGDLVLESGSGDADRAAVISNNLTDPGGSNITVNFSTETPGPKNRVLLWTDSNLSGSYSDATNAVQVDLTSSSIFIQKFEGGTYTQIDNASVGSGPKDVEVRVRGTHDAFDYELAVNGSTVATGSANYAPTASARKLALVGTNAGDDEVTFANVTAEYTSGTPTADAGPNQTVLTDETVSLDASGSRDPDGSIAGYEWDIDDDGNYEKTGITNATSFADDGDQNVTMRVTDDDGNTATDTLTVTVENRAPTASTTANETVILDGDTVEFNGTGSSDPDGSISAYAWDTDGDGTNESTNATPTATYASTGTYTATLTVTDDDGATATETITIEVVDDGPVPRIDVDPTQPLTDETVTLNGSDSLAPNGSISAYEWDVDDNGNFSLAGVNVTTSFADDGDQNVTLRVTNDTGATAATTTAIDIQNRGPTAAVAVDDGFDPGEAGTLSASGSKDPDGSIAGYEWDLDGDLDFADATGMTISTTFDEAGTHVITLRATDDDGSTDTVERVVTVDDGSTPLVFGGGTVNDNHLQLIALVGAVLLALKLLGDRS